MFTIYRKDVGGRVFDRYFRSWEEAKKVLLEELQTAIEHGWKETGSENRFHADKGFYIYFHELFTDHDEIAILSLIDGYFQDNDDIYTYHEMENAVHLSADLMEELSKHDDKYKFEDMRARADFLIQKAVELERHLGGKNEKEGNYDYVEELEKFEKKVLEDMNN